MAEVNEKGNLRHYNWSKTADDKNNCIRVLGLALCHERKGSWLSLVPYSEIGAQDLFGIK